jgi:preprotein translocase subunit SecA
LEGEDISDAIKDMITEAVVEKLSEWTSSKYPEEWDWESIAAWLLRSFGIKYDSAKVQDNVNLNIQSLTLDISEEALDKYNKRKEELGAEIMLHIQRMVLLQMIDSSWRDHLYELDQIKRGIGFRAYAQKDPKVEYQKEAFALFESMMKRIRDNTIEYIFKVQVMVNPNPQPQQTENNPFQSSNTSALPSNNNKISNKPITAAKQSKDLNKIGRNDLCPCGSGKKYKKCCGKDL